MGWQSLFAANIQVVDRAAAIYADRRGNGCERIADTAHWETMHGPACDGPRADAVGVIEWDDPYADS